MREEQGDKGMFPLPKAAKEIVLFAKEIVGATECVQRSRRRGTL
jgi:hypothetical protein